MRDCICGIRNCVFYSLCHCGCGKTTTISKDNRASSGYIKGKHKLWFTGHRVRKRMSEEERSAKKRKRWKDFYSKNKKQIKEYAHKRYVQLKREFADGTRTPLQEKICPQCKILKNASEYSKSGHSVSGLGYTCKTCDFKRVLERGRIQRYGITPKEYASMLEIQGGLCKICNRTDWRKENLAVDHCHKTGKIRGLLCNRCNLALGNVGESIEVLRGMIKYIEENADTHLPL